MTAETDPQPAETPSTTLGVLLAAGGGTRFGGARHKLLAELPETADEPATSVFTRSLDHLRRAAIGPIVVVSGALHDELIVAAGTAAVSEITFLRNHRWSDGQMTSLHAAITHARAIGAQRIVVGLADQPAIDPSAWRAVTATAGPITVATYHGRRANPVALAAEVWDLLAEDGDEGARTLMRVRPDLVREVACSGSPADIDTEEDLRRWQNS